MVKPLIDECTNRESKLNEYRDRTHSMSRHIKMIRAILNFPALIKQFRISCKKEIAKLEQKPRYEKAIHTLRSYGLDDVFKNNVEQLDQLAKELEHCK